ncbi:MAG: 2OG-Fe(II) oxygenase [Proteobacteria bacterium]|nr:2OG-Fe(II) oxygenase [Pseudomonadota bacterium]
MLQISKADVVADPFPHVIKQDILPPALFKALKADYPGAEVFAHQKSAHGAAGSRTGTGFDLYRGDSAFDDLLAHSEAWREFTGFINSERFADTFREVFADYIDDIGLRVDLAHSHIDPGFVEPREIMTETATVMDQVAGVGLKVVDQFRKPAPVPLFTRLDIHRSAGGYAKPPHCDRSNRLASLIVYFMDADEAGLEGGELLIFKHKTHKAWKDYERHPKPSDVDLVATLKPKSNLGVFFPCQNNSYHGVTQVTSQGVSRDFLYINISGRTRSLWF